MSLFEQLTAAAEMLAATARGQVAAQAALDDALATLAPPSVIAERTAARDRARELVGERATTLAAAAGPHRTLIAELVAALGKVLEGEEYLAAVGMDMGRRAQAAAALAPHEARRDAARAALRDAIQAAEIASTADDGDAELEGAPA